MNDYRETLTYVHRYSRYVATEKGILEYTVNINERKTFPGISLQ